MKQIRLYDATLREGNQTEDISFSVEDKLRITQRLDELGHALYRGRLARLKPEGFPVFQGSEKLPPEKRRRYRLRQHGKAGHQQLKKIKTSTSLYMPGQKR